MWAGGSSSRQTDLTTNKPVDSSIVGIVDFVDIEGKRVSAIGSGLLILVGVTRDDTADDVAWHSGNSSKATHPVATKTANELDLYDMSGNVYEWCQDCYGENYYASSPSQDPACDNNSGYRVCRGGAFSVEAKNCRLSFRDSDSSNHKSESLGLRLIMKQ